MSPISLDSPRGAGKYVSLRVNARGGRMIYAPGDIHGS
jgi:hypothetical protein